MKRILTAIIAGVMFGSASAQEPKGSNTDSNTGKPFSFWYWMYGAVNKPAIKADLVGMKNVGLRGTYLMPIRGVDEKPEYGGKAQQLSPEFWDMVGYSMHIADSLGLELGVHICDGFALAGGPWFTEEESMQRIVSKETYISVRELKNSKTNKISLPWGGQGWVFAVPCTDTITVLTPVSMTHSDNVTSDEKFLVSANDDCWFTFDFGRGVSVRNVEVIPSGTNFQSQRLSVEASVDGITFEKLKDFAPARQGWQNYLYNMTYSLPYMTDASGKEKEYRYYRFSWTPKGTEPGSEDLDAAKWKANLRLKGLVFHHDARLDQWEGKSGLAWRISEESTAKDLPQSLCIPKERLIPLSINSDGTIDLSPIRKSISKNSLPREGWGGARIIYIGHESTGMTNATAGGGKGLECDKFSKAAVNKLVDNWFCKFSPIPTYPKESPLPTSPKESPLPTSPKESPLPTSPRGGDFKNASVAENNEQNNTLAAEKVNGQNIFNNLSPSGESERGSGASPLHYLHVDSWECGCQNWSSNFADEFKARRGYDLMPWLPVMVGIPVESAAETERVLRDVRLTINDLINDVFFATVRERAHQMGMQFSSESVAPTMISDGLDHYRYADLPMGEYWLNSPTHDKPNDMLDAISGGHIYGKNIIQAEGFTEVRGVWDETPASIKTLLDRNFALGMNRLFFHVNAHNPWLDRKPGMTLDGIGLFFQRDQIWYPEAKPFVDYVTRCSALLQQGRPVQDIAVYIGDEMPRRAMLPERLVPMLPGLFGDERVASEQKRLDNIDQPITESPVGVRHSAGIVDTKDWINPLHGYQYDSLNPDVLLNHSTVKVDKNSLPSREGWGGSLCLDGGAEYRVLVVPGKRLMNPNGIISDAAKSKIEELRKAGVVVVDKPYTDADFSKYGLTPDITLPDGIAYTHRTTADGEIYFLSNQKDQPVSFDATLRDISGTPYIYSAVTNTIMSATYNDKTVTVSLPATGSCFVLIAKNDINALTACLPEQPTFINSLPTGEGWGEALNGPFSLYLREADNTLNMPSLKSWSDLSPSLQGGQGESLRYFSGHGRYTTTVKLKKKPTGNETLALGEVHDIAHVWVNGIDCGIVWTSPYEAQIGKALEKGNNTIEIEVVNTWANALRGMDEGKMPYAGIWTNAKYRMKEPYLLPAGLLGPVKITR